MKTDFTATGMMQRDFGLQLAEQMGGQAAGGIIGQGLGMLFQNQNNQNQLNQQQALTNMNQTEQENLMNDQYTNQMKMWNATNYPAQMQQIQEAGLNPALMYHGAGAGGTTTGGGMPSGTAGQAAPAPNAGATMNAGMGINPMTTAQIDNMEADTKLKSAQAEKLSGVDTENVAANTALQNAQTANQKITATIQESSETDQIKQIDLQAQSLQQQVNQLQNQTDISDATKQDQISTIKTGAVNAVITGNLMKAGIKVDNSQIQKMSQDIAQGWQQLNLQQQQQKVQQILMNAQATTAGSSGQLMDKEKSLLTTQTIIQGIGALGGLLKNTTGIAKDVMQ